MGQLRHTTLQATVRLQGYPQANPPLHCMYTSLAVRGLRIELRNMWHMLCAYLNSGKWSCALFLFGLIVVYFAISWKI